MHLVAIRDQWRRIIAAQIEEKPEPQLVQIGKPKTASNSKSENPLKFFAKTENQMLKYGKSANRNEHQNRKTDLENSQNSKNRKSQCPPPTGQDINISCD